MQTPTADVGPTWMYVAIGALTLLQVVAGYFLSRALAALDRVTRLCEQHEVKIAKAEEEVERLRDRKHGDVNREQADMADRELRRLLLEELRSVRADRQRGAA